MVLLMGDKTRDKIKKKRLRGHGNMYHPWERFNIGSGLFTEVLLDGGGYWKGDHSRLTCTSSTSVIVFWLSSSSPQLDWRVFL